MNNKIIVIVGTTASGKTTLGVDLAYKYNGEIISADSRQVYKGMDIGTGKDICEYTIKKRGQKLSIPYHLIDVVDPKTEFNLAKFYKLANKAIFNLLKKGKTPIIVGGTGLYAQAIVDGYNLNSIKPDKKLREKLEKMSVDKLYKKLLKINSKFAKSLNESENKNKRRLIRHIEIMSEISKNGDKEIKDINNLSKKRGNEFLIIGLTWSREVLRDRIYRRLIERLDKEEMIGEVRGLHYEKKVSWKRLIGFGLEYKYISLYLKHKISYEEMIEKLYIAICQFSKKQMTWYKRWEKQGQKIHWVKDDKKINILVKDFLEK